MTTAITVKKEDLVIPGNQIIMGEIFCFIHEGRQSTSHDYYMKVSDQQVVQLATGVVLPFYSDSASNVQLYDAEITLYPKHISRNDLQRRNAPPVSQ